MTLLCLFVGAFKGAQRESAAVCNLSRLKMGLTGGKSSHRSLTCSTQELNVGPVVSCWGTRPHNRHCQCSVLFVDAHELLACLCLVDDHGL
jgi:hypothetical protein